MATLFISDLDGTLLQPDATLSSRAAVAINDWIDQGVHFTVATARSTYSVRRILDGVNLKLPVVTFNGGFISDFQTGQHLRHWGLDAATSERVVRHCLAEGFSPFVSTTAPDRDRLFIGEARNAGMQWYIDERRTVGDPRVIRERPEAGLQYEVMCLTLVDKKGPLRRLQQQLHGLGDIRTHLYVNRYDPQWWWLTVHPQRATKAGAIRTMLDDSTLRLPMCDRLVVFGDAANDLEMFGLADVAVAPANAEEILLPAATSRCRSNAEDGVIEWIHEYLEAPKSQI